MKINLLTLLFVQSVCTVGTLISAPHLIERLAEVSIVDIAKRYDLQTGEANWVTGMKFYYGHKGSDGQVKRDLDLAFRQFAIAAEKGFLSGVFMMARMKLFGIGVPQDYTAGVLLLAGAAEMGYPPAQVHMASILKEKNIEDDPKIERQAVELIRRAAVQGDDDALIHMGMRAQEGLDDFGRVMNPDYEQAFSFFKKSADEGSYAGMYHLAQFYRSGFSDKKDAPRAKRLFEKILSSNSPLAYIYQGLIHETGCYGTRNLQRAKECYESDDALDESLRSPHLIRVERALLRHAKKACEIERELIGQEEGLSTKKTRNKKNRQESRSSRAIKQGESSATFPEYIKDCESIDLIDEVDIAGESVKRILNNVLSYGDKSTIAAIDTQSNIITIENPEDGSIVTIEDVPLKRVVTAKILQKLKMFDYDDRVKRWFVDDAQSFEEGAQQDKIRHRFAQRVDQIVQLYGSKAYFLTTKGAFVKNRILKGSVKTQDGSLLEGRFEYAYYKDGRNQEVLYHRFLHPHSRAQLKMS